MVNETEGRIRQIVAYHLGVSADDLAPEVSLTDELAADSLDLFELTVVLEEELGVQMPESVLEHVRTYGELLAVTTAALRRTLRPKSAAGPSVVKRAALSMNSAAVDRRRQRVA